MRSDRGLGAFRAPSRQAGGHWFEPSTAHKNYLLIGLSWCQIRRRRESHGNKLGRRSGRRRGWAGGFERTDASGRERRQRSSASQNRLSGEPKGTVDWGSVVRACIAGARPGGFGCHVARGSRRARLAMEVLSRNALHGEHLRHGSASKPWRLRRWGSWRGVVCVVSDVSVLCRRSGASSDDSVS